MWDDFIDMSKFSIAIIAIIVVGGLACSFYNIGKNLMHSTTVEFEQTVNSMTTEDTTTANIQASVNTLPNYTSTLIKDANGKIIGIAFNSEDDIIIENVEVQADTVVNTNNYVDNTQNIVNEAPAVSYVIPCTIAIIAAFVIILFDRYTKHKKEEAAYTEKILNTPLQTFKQTEVEELKEKYN